MSERPNQDQFEAFAARAGEGPVYMLNLLAFTPDGGAERYATYMRHVEPLLAGVGGKVHYLGRGAELLIGREDEHWDLALLVQYPSRGALLEVIRSPEYQAISHHREDALTRSVLLATDPVDR